jgi:ATP-dependent DNA helicase PIF1
MYKMESTTTTVPVPVSAPAPPSVPTTFSDEQTHAFNLYAKGKNVFLTGPGGTGKSFLIKKMIEHANVIGKSCVVNALTGCAAILLDCNATTIHSWSGIGMMKGDDETIIRRIAQKKDLRQHWKTDILIIDEVSMMSKRMFELLNAIAKRIRNSSLPFGGMQVIFVGDFFQLPPVEADGFCFESEEWFETFPKNQHLELKTFFRQSDPVYIDILMKIRKGTLDKESIAHLEKYVARDRDQPITKIVPTRKQADFINQDMFGKIKDNTHTMDATIHKELILYFKDGKPIEPSVLKMCNELRETEKDRELENLIKNNNIQQTLQLKKGTLVMCLRNIDLPRGVCNGSQGTVVDIVKGRPMVLFSNGHRMLMEQQIYQSEVYPTVAVCQFPLCLAWAMTIHKIQGSSLTHAQIDIGNSIFEYGQTYVALSRVKTMDGLYLMNFQPKRIKSHPKVIEFYESLQ